MTLFPTRLPRVLLAALLVSAFAAGAAAQETPTQSAESAPARKGKGGLRTLLGKAGDRVREEAMKRFDKDGDGKLDDAERAEALESLKKKGADVQAQFRQLLLRRFDADKNGTLDETERTAALDEVMKQLEQNGPMVKNTVLGMVKNRFDADGDGTLSKDELAAARDELTARLLQSVTGGAKAAPLDPAVRRKQTEEARKKERLDRYDADGDGTLDESERERAKEDLKKLYDDVDTSSAAEKSAAE